MNKINIWDKEKAKFQNMMEEKDFMIEKLQSKVEELNQKNLSLE